MGFFGSILHGVSSAGHIVSGGITSGFRHIPLGNPIVGEISSGKLFHSVGGAFGSVFKKGESLVNSQGKILGGVEKDVAGAFHGVSGLLNSPIAMIAIAGVVGIFLLKK